MEVSSEFAKSNSSRDRGSSADGNRKVSALNAGRRMAALLGGVLDPSLVPKFNFRIFVSSTFTDTHAERNVLLEKVVPTMRELAGRHGMEFTAIDMRYGVRDENTDDHKTWIACRQELDKCFEKSCGIFFLSLQGGKYGYRPIPKYLTVDQFSSRLACSSISAGTRDLASRWYVLDDNNIPPRYELQQLNAQNRNEFWVATLPTLRQLLAGLEFDDNQAGCAPLLLDRSITEWEMKSALSDAGSLKRCLWWHRQLEGGVSLADDPKRLFDDVTGDVNLETKLQDLLSYMSTRLHRSNMISASLSSADYKDEHCPPMRDTLQHLEVSMLALLKSEVDSAACAKMDWHRDGCGIGLPGDVLDDIFHHCSWATAKNSTFLGRESLANEAMMRIQSSAGANNLGTCLALIGKSVSILACDLYSRFLYRNDSVS